MSGTYAQESQSIRNDLMDNSSRVRTVGFPGGDSDRTRPPKPTKQRDDLHFPPGFLQHSKPSEVSDTADTPQEGKRDSSSTPSTDKKNETAPSQPRDDAEPNIEPVRARDDTTLLGIIVSAALLGIFVFADYRYRCWLQSALLQNNRLLAPEAAASDFDEVFMATGTPPLSLAGVVPGNFPLLDSMGGYDSSVGFTSSENAGSLPLASVLNTGEHIADEFFASSAEQET